MIYRCNAYWEVAPEVVQRKMDFEVDSYEEKFAQLSLFTPEYMAARLCSA
jgi:hypothetical protein